MHPMIYNMDMGEKFDHYIRGLWGNPTRRNDMTPEEEEERRVFYEDRIMGRKLLRFAQAVHTICLLEYMDMELLKWPRQAHRKMNRLETMEEKYQFYLTNYNSYH